MGGPGPKVEVAGGSAPSRGDGTALTELFRSPWSIWVALRYLRSKKHSRFLSLITFISIAGVAVGVTAMIVVLSVMDGFEGELRKRLMATEVHVLLQPTSEAPGFSGGYVTQASLQATEVPRFLAGHPEVTAFEPVLATEAILRSGRKVSGVQVKGVSNGRLRQIRKNLVESAEPQMLVQRDGGDTIRLPGLFVGKELAYEMNLIPGDRLTLVSPLETEGPLSSVPRVKRFVVEGIYSTAAAEEEMHTVFAADTSVRAFLRRQDVVTQWEVSVKDFDRAPALAEELRRRAPLFRVRDWMQLNQHLFASLKLERVAMFVALALIVVVASFNIVTTLTLMVLEKRREISILKAMGATRSQVGAIFLAEGLLIGGSGVGLGALLGFGICVVLRRYELISLPDAYYDRRLPVAFEPSYYLLISISALLIVVLACRYPSRRAASVSPLDGIRFG